MCAYLILVRHAAVSVDPTIESHQWQLTTDGRAATYQLAHKLKPYNPNRIFTSQEPKAVATGAALADVLRMPTQVVPGLQEHNRQGVPYFERKVDFETAVAHLFAHPDELVFGKETAVQASGRFETAVIHLFQAHPQETLILTTHGTVMTLFISHHNPALEAFPFWQTLTMPQACILNWPSKQLFQTILV